MVGWITGRAIRVAGRNSGRTGLLAGLAADHTGLVAGWDVGRADLAALHVCRRGHLSIGRHDFRAKRLAGGEGGLTERMAGQVGR